MHTQSCKSMTTETESMVETNDAEQQQSAVDTGDGSAEAAKQKPNSRRRRPLIIVAILVLVAVVAYATYWFLYAQYHATTDDAYVQGNIISVSPRVSGTVVAINADDTDLVHAGD